MVKVVLLRLFESYFRHPLLNLAPLLVALIAGGAYLAITPPQYVATGNIYVEKESLLAVLTASDNADVWVTAAEGTLTELEELLSTKAFVRSAIQNTKLEAEMSKGPDAIAATMDFFISSIKLDTPGEKLVMIAATSDDPELSSQIVNATLGAYVQWKIYNDFQESVAAQAFFEQQIPPYIEQVNKTRQALVAYLKAHPVPVVGDRPAQEDIEIERLQAEVARAEERLNAAQANEESARLSMAESESVTRQTYLVIDQPEIPTDSELTVASIATTIAIFGAVGLVVSIVIIVVSALSDRSMRFPIDVRHVLSLPTLALIPVADPQLQLQAQASNQGKPVETPTTASDGSVLQPQV